MKAFVYVISCGKKILFFKAAGIIFLWMKTQLQGASMLISESIFCDTVSYAGKDGFSF